MVVLPGRGPPGLGARRQPERPLAALLAGLHPLPQGHQAQRHTQAGEKELFPLATCMYLQMSFFPGLLLAAEGEGLFAL